MEGALEIDYLARNSIPTRLDIRHQIVQNDTAYSNNSPTNDFFIQLEGWQRRHDDQPSDYLVEPRGRDFRESFSATQWIVLGQNNEIKNHD
ncbi:hypothetical protein P4S72_20155 [Vibrio sp. PP-XX7]